MPVMAPLQVHSLLVFRECGFYSFTFPLFRIQQLGLAPNATLHWEGREEKARALEIHIMGNGGHAAMR